MVWPFSMLWRGRSKAAPSPSPSPAKKVARKASRGGMVARKSSPVADAGLLDAWQGRTVRELREQLEEVGWDVESLDRLLARVGEPENGAPDDAGARSPATRTKRARSPIRLHDDDEQDEVIDLSPRLTSRKEVAALSPPQDANASRKWPPQRANLSPPGSPAPRVQLPADVSAMSPKELKAEFTRIFGYPPRSGNLDWLRRKLDALQNGTDLNAEGPVERKGRRPMHTLLGSPGQSPPASPQ